MSVFSGSHKNLWQYISGNTSNNRSSELVKEELNKYEKYLSKGLSIYKRNSPLNNESLKKIKREKKRKFMEKLSSYLGGLDIDMCLELFNSYLLHQFKGTIDDMRTGLDDERYTQNLLLEFSEYYHSERLYLLRSIKHVLCCWQIDEHAHKAVYTDFVERQPSLLKTILSQYDAVLLEAPPEPNVYTLHKTADLNIMWMTNNLKEQCDLLEILLLYFKDFDKSAQDLVDLLTKFTKQGFGHVQPNKQLVDEEMKPILHRIGQLQVLILLEGMDLERLNQCAETDTIDQHPIISTNFQAVDDVIDKYGDIAAHCPIMLAWTVFRHVTQADGAITKRLGNVALQNGVFVYLLELLRTEPFNGKTFMANLSRYILYNLMTVLLNVFVESSLGDSERLYELVSELVKEPFISEDIWTKGLDHGIGTMMKSAWARLPEDPNTCLSLCTALTTDSSDCVLRLHALFENRVLGGNCTGWQLISSELNHTRQALEYAAAGGVSKPGTVLRIQHIMNLVAPVMNSSRDLPGHQARDVISRCDDMLLDVFPILHRLSTQPNPSLDAIKSCLLVIIALARIDPDKVIYGLRQTNFLPQQMEKFKDVADACSCSGMNYGLCGQLLGTYEISQAHYPVTTTLLDLILVLMTTPAANQNVPRTSVTMDTSSPAFLATVAMIPCLLYVAREIFPAFRKWRYHRQGPCELIGQRCLEIFHRALNSKPEQKEFNTMTGKSLIYHSLLYTESGRTLLDIISTGSDLVDIAIAQQGSIEEGGGVDLMRQIRLSFSVLNQLMILRPDDADVSPVERALFSKQTVAVGQPHILVTMAQYIYLRHDSRLPTMATLMLKKIALLLPMSLMACLGSEGPMIRNVFVNRLQSYTEDVRLRVGILELLTTCVDAQPGLIEHFLNMKDSKTDDKKYVLGDVSCLKAVLELLTLNKQGSAHCPPELLCAVTGFLHALWYGQRERAMLLLRQTPDFWENVLSMFMMELEEPKEDQDMAFSLDLKTLSFIFRILSLELFDVKGKVESNLLVVLNAISRENGLVKWSKYITAVVSKCRPVDEVDLIADDRGLLGVASSADESPDWAAHSCMQLLNSWRQLLIVAASHQEGSLKIESRDRDVIMCDVMNAMRAQLSQSLNRTRVRLLSVLVNLQFILLQHWKGDVENIVGMVNKLTRLLEQSITDTHRSLSTLHTGVIGSIVSLLQYQKHLIKEGDRIRLLKLICLFLHKTNHQINPAPEEPQLIDAKIKPQTAAVCLLEELMANIPNCALWLSVLQEYSIIPLLLSSLPQWIQAGQGAQYVEAVVMLFQSLAENKEAAESLCMNGMNKDLCLVISNLYADDNDLLLPMPELKQYKPDNSVSWLAVYKRFICLQSTLIQTLRYNYVRDALDFVGVHHERMIGCLKCVRVAVYPCRLDEAKATCHFIFSLCLYARQWRLELPQIMQALLVSMSTLVHTCISLLIRPGFLQHLLDRHSNKADTIAATFLGRSLPSRTTTLHPYRLHSQSSTSEDCEQVSDQLHNVQYQLVTIVTEAMGAYRKLSPELDQILLDYSIDVTEYENVLMMNFTPPAGDQEAIVSYGSLISLINWSTLTLSKLEARAASPARSPTTVHRSPITKSSVMYVLESTLTVLMCQAARQLRDSNVSPRDKLFLKRELSGELNSYLQSFQRLLRKGAPPSPSSNISGALHPSPQQLQRPLSFMVNDSLAYKLVNTFVEQVLR